MQIDIQGLDMIGLTRIDLYSFFWRVIGGRRHAAGCPGRGFFAGIAALIVVTTPLAAGPAQAGEEFIDFEEFTGPRKLAAAEPPLTMGTASFSGGQIVSNVATLRRVNRSTVYGTAHFCNGCQSTITIEFSQPVSNVSFMLMNGRLARPWFEIRDDTGQTIEFRLGSYFGQGSRKLITLPSSGIKKIVIGQTDSVTAFWWQFYIDNLRYTVDEGQQYLVNFSAFVPHDNVPAAPTAFCLSKNNWQPSGLKRVGRSPTDKARWARDDDFAPGNGRPPVSFDDEGTD
ncbi:MAG: hypothetical protein IMF05_05980, partial [Proteobacteria bacterium]|nr:hypothetical protein [Pseudomonadota bacterium]